MQLRTVRVLSYTGRFIRRQLQFDLAQGAMFVTIGQQVWFVEPTATHFRCARRRYRPGDSTQQEATHHA